MFVTLKSRKYGQWFTAAIALIGFTFGVACKSSPEIIKTSENPVVIKELPDREAHNLKKQAGQQTVQNTNGGISDKSGVKYVEGLRRKGFQPGVNGAREEEKNKRPNEDNARSLGESQRYTDISGRMSDAISLGGITGALAGRTHFSENKIDELKIWLGEEKNGVCIALGLPAQYYQCEENAQTVKCTETTAEACPSQSATEFDEFIAESRETNTFPIPLADMYAYLKYGAKACEKELRTDAFDRIHGFSYESGLVNIIFESQNTPCLLDCHWHGDDALGDHEGHEDHHGTVTCEIMPPS